MQPAISLARTDLEYQAVILCGGLGTRLMPLTRDKPKPMVDVNGQPFLMTLLEQLSDQGIKRFVLLTGYLGGQIQEYFGDGKQWGWSIQYSHGPDDWDTGRRFWEVLPKLDGTVLLLYSDNFAHFNFQENLTIHQKANVSASLYCARKQHGNICLSNDGSLISTYDSSRKGDDLNYVEVGYMFLQTDKIRRYFSVVPNSPSISFSRVLECIVAADDALGIICQTGYQSVSDVERLEHTKNYLKSKKILLLDRDGTINTRANRGEYISSYKDIQYIEDTVESLVELSKNGFEFVVISNQAGIGRGVVDAAKVKALNNSIQSDLKMRGIRILDFYVCPHHWEDGCSCRKPAPGLFYQCARDYNIRLDKAIYVGDDPRDFVAAANAATNCIYIGHEPLNLKGKLLPLKFWESEMLSTQVQEILKFYGA